MKIYWCMTQSIPDADRSFERNGFLSINPSNSASSNRWITAARRLQVCQIFSLFQVTRGIGCDKKSACGGATRRGVHPGDEDNWPALCLKCCLLNLKNCYFFLTSVLWSHRKMSVKMLRATTVDLIYVISAPQKKTNPRTAVSASSSSASRSWPDLPWFHTWMWCK